MVRKHFYVGLLVVLGVASGTTACGGVDGEGYPEQWDDAEMSEQAMEDPNRVPILSPRYPNCGIIACPDGTECRFDDEGEARCTAPPGATCSTVNCGRFHYCQMTATGAICVSGSSDI